MACPECRALVVAHQKLLNELQESTHAIDPRGNPESSRALAAIVQKNAITRGKLQTIRDAIKIHQEFCSSYRGISRTGG